MAGEGREGKAWSLPLTVSSPPPAPHSCLAALSCSSTVLVHMWQLHSTWSRRQGQVWGQLNSSFPQLGGCLAFKVDRGSHSSGMLLTGEGDLSCVLLPPSLQLPHQSHPGVSTGKRAAGGCGGQRQAESDQTGGLHQLHGCVPDHAAERLPDPRLQGEKARWLPGEDSVFLPLPTAPSHQPFTSLPRTFTYLPVHFLLRFWAADRGSLSSSVSAPRHWPPQGWGVRPQGLCPTCAASAGAQIRSTSVGLAKKSVHVFP